VKATANQQVTNAQSALASAANNLQLNSSVSNSTIVNNAYADLANTIKSVSVTAQRILEDSDSVLGVDNTMLNVNFKNILGVTAPGTLDAAKNSYLQAKALKTSLDNIIVNLDDTNSGAVDAAATAADQTLTAFQGHLYDMQKLLDATITSSGLSQAQLDGFRSAVGSDRSSINSALSGLDSSIQAVASAKSSLNGLQISYDKVANDLKVAQSQADQNVNNALISIKSKQLALDQANSAYKDLIAPVREVDLASARAQLTSAAIAVDRANYNMSQATLTSPIDGVVSMLNYKVGDIIISSSSADTTVATIINTNTLFIEANVEEASISKLKVGDKAQVTFDAIDGLTLDGEISFISLTSTTSSNGIVTYLVRVIVNNAANTSVREGMTASLNFITAEAPNVIAVPVDAVHNVNGLPSVELANGQFTPVTTGFTDGSDVEIISGLKEGDVVLY